MGTVAMFALYVYDLLPHLSPHQGFPIGSVVENPLEMQETCRRCRFNPWSERSPGEGNGNPLQYSCLGNPMDREEWATLHGVAKSDMTEVTEHAHPSSKLKFESVEDFSLGFQ